MGDAALSVSQKPATDENTQTASRPRGTWVPSPLAGEGPGVRGALLSTLTRISSEAGLKEANCTSYRIAGELTRP